MLYSLSSALFLHLISCRCMYYVSCMYVASVFPVLMCVCSPLQSTEPCARHE